MMVSKASVVAVVSGGLDSVTLAYHLASSGFDLEIVTFDYGQRHRKEMVFAKACASRLGVASRQVDLTSIAQLMEGSSLTSLKVDVPHSQYEEESMRHTVVPNRNAIMINIAAALAVSTGRDAVAVGVHGGDHFVYPDCRPDFIKSQSSTLRLANAGYVAEGFKVLAPFVGISKAEIVKIGHALGVPWLETWSCYRGLDVHCGRCGTCIERQQAFVLAGIADPTNYAMLSV